MGEEIGMIVVVKNAKTVNAKALSEWLHNENRERYTYCSMYVDHSYWLLCGLYIYWMRFECGYSTLSEIGSIRGRRMPQ